MPVFKNLQHPVQFLGSPLSSQVQLTPADLDTHSQLVEDALQDGGRQSSGDLRTGDSEVVVP